ncbi:hypothetical protein DIE21_32815 [Burkholderia sp. Bp9140]|nr:hypothetical protein DIE21_32815 [Burkholderia sp. Bp9140]
MKRLSLSRFWHQETANWPVDRGMESLQWPSRHLLEPVVRARNHGAQLRLFILGDGVMVDLGNQVRADGRHLVNRALSSSAKHPA